MTGIQNSHQVLTHVLNRLQEQQNSREARLLEAIRGEWRAYGEVRSSELLAQIGFASETLFDRILVDHPAAELARSVENIDRAYGIIVSARNGLVGAAGRLHFQLVHGSLSEVDLDEILAAATKEVFTYATASEAIVQGYRHVLSIRPESTKGYEKLKDEFLDPELMKFFKDLRNNNNHVEIVQASPHYKIQRDFAAGSSNVTSGLSFNREAIITGTEWSQPSKSMASNNEILDVVALVTRHFEIAKQIYSRFSARSGIHGDTYLRDFRKLKTARKSVSLRVSLGIILQIAIPKKLNPYEYLDRWFTSDELDRAYCFPDRSRAQVDYLISLRDPLHLCDDGTRSRLYELFSTD